ncbi:MAG: pantetheine-phosphate adenylyltransferase [Candidatus Methanomethylicia archaeon]|jgi:pantetheine-phosphate adenylyltransferase|nr:pantetheine-phosphate adenylyltransferase [Candidatus Methanomethylicia archaeon]
MPEHRIVAVGGTFDHLHVGHEHLISKAFEIGEFVIIGVTSDEFLKRLSKQHDQEFAERCSKLIEFLKSRGFLERSRIVTLDDPFGPTISDPSIEGIVVTEETAPRAEEANRIRKERGMESMEIYVVDYVKSSNGLPVSSTRIRNKEIDEKGNLIKH